MDPEQIWQAAQEELRFQLSKPSYETWLKNASLVGRERNDFRIGVPTKLAKDWLEDRYSAMIKETLSALVSGDVTVAFEVVSDAGTGARASRQAAAAGAGDPARDGDDRAPGGAPREGGVRPHPGNVGVASTCAGDAAMTPPAPPSRDYVANVPLPRSPQEPYPSLRAWCELSELERQRSQNEQTQTDMAAGR